MGDLRPLNAVTRIMTGLLALPGRKAAVLFSENTPEMRFYHSLQADQISQASVNIYQCALPGWKSNWKDLAEETGGPVVKAETERFEEIKQIMQDYDHCCLLGYVPDDKTLDVDCSRTVTGQGPDRTIRISSTQRNYELRVKMNRGGLKVRTRQSFSSSLLVPKSNPLSPRDSDLMYKARLSDSPFLSGNLEVSAEAIPFYSEEKKSIVYVTLNIEGEDLVFGPGTGEGNRIAEAEVTGFITLESYLNRHTGQASFTAPIEGFEEKRKQAWNTNFAMEVPGPGLYNLRTKVLQSMEGRFGNRSILVEVPEFRSSGLVASGIVTYKQSNNSASQPNGYKVTRKFHRSDPIVCYIQIYNAIREKSSGKTNVESQLRLYKDNSLVKASNVLNILEPVGNTASNRIALNFEVNPDKVLTACNYQLEILIVDHLAGKKKNTLVKTVAIELVE